VLLAVGTPLAIIATRFSALEEARQTQIKEIAQLEHDVESLDGRIRTLETNNELKVRVNVIAEDVTFIRGQLEELRDDARRRHR
jgi:predicted  nucleic acid-binding Zn-ribbon protein